MTPFETKCDILADLWLNLRYDEEFTDFIAYNDLGLPLAYAFSEGLVEPTDISKPFVEEAFAGLLAALNIDDAGFDNLGDLLDSANQ